MDDVAAPERLLAVECVTEPLIEAQIGGEKLVGVETDQAITGGDGDLFGMCHQMAAMAAALAIRRYRQILDQEMVRLRDHFDQSHERASSWLIPRRPGRFHME